MSASTDMPRNFQDILAEVSAQSDPQRKAVLSQIDSLPAQQQADEAGLEAKKTAAYDEILGGARRRGLGFSGIPLGEQAKYNATDYAPALANLRSSYNTRKGTLEAALADIGARNYSTANDIYNADRTFEEQQRQYNENMAFQREQAAAQQRAAAAQNASLAGLYKQPQPQQQQSVGSMAAKKNGGGFEFTDKAGNPISAAKYAQNNGINITDLLRTMAQNGDAYAANAYNWFKKVQGMDFVNTPEKLMNVAKKNLSPLFWGL